MSAALGRTWLASGEFRGRWSALPGQFDNLGNMAMMAGMSTDFVFAPQTRDGHRLAG
jgi:hypothetical protein